MGALVAILRAMGATSATRCVLRPALREEARKAIGARLAPLRSLNRHPCGCCHACGTGVHQPQKVRFLAQRVQCKFQSPCTARAAVTVCLHLLCTTLLVGFDAQSGGPTS